MAELRGASNVVLCEPASRRRDTDSMSRVKPAKMLMLRSLLSTSDMVTPLPDMTSWGDAPGRTILACASGVLGENDFAEVAVRRQATAASEVAKVVRAFMIVRPRRLEIGDGDQGAWFVFWLHSTSLSRLLVLAPFVITTSA